MQTILIDLKKNPDIADLVADMQPGDAIDLHGTIKSLDDQTLEITIEEASKGKEEPAPETPEPAEPGDEMSPPQAGAGPDAARDIGGSELASGA